MEDNVVCVIATEKHTGLIKTCTSCDKENANHYTKSRTVTYEELEQIYEKEKQEIDDRRIQEWLLAI